MESYEKLKKELLKDKEVALHYKKLKTEFAFIEKVIKKPTKQTF